jgi:IKI3 family
MSLHITVTYEVVLYRDSLDAYNLKILHIGAKASRNPAECLAELNSLQIMDCFYQRFYIDRNL